MKFRYIKKKIAEREAKEALEQTLTQREAEDRIMRRINVSEPPPSIHGPVWTQTTDDRLTEAEKRLRSSVALLASGAVTHRWCCRCKLYKAAEKGTCRYASAWVCFPCWDLMTSNERASFYHNQAALAAAIKDVRDSAPPLAIVKPAYQRRPDGHLGGVEQ